MDGWVLRYNAPRNNERSISQTPNPPIRPPRYTYNVVYTVPCTRNRARDQDRAFTRCLISRAARSWSRTRFRVHGTVYTALYVYRGGWMGGFGRYNAHYFLLVCRQSPTSWGNVMIRTPTAATGALPREPLPPPAPNPDKKSDNEPETHNTLIRNLKMSPRLIIL